VSISDKDRLELAHELAHYIIQFESHDFFYQSDEESLDTHVYYKAVIFRDGKKEADRDLKAAKRYRNDESYVY